MSHQMSIVHHFFPINVEDLEKNFFRKNCSISENQHKTTLKISILLKNIYMSHQSSIIHHFFPLNLHVLEKKFSRKSWSISKN